jgi:hypothetical protein
MGRTAHFIDPSAPSYFFRPFVQRAVTLNRCEQGSRDDLVHAFGQG